VSVETDRQADFAVVMGNKDS